MKIHSFCIGSIALAVVLASVSVASAQAPPPSPRLMQFIEGVDAAPKKMSDDDAKRQLNDAWGASVLRNGNFPVDIGSVLAAIDKISPQTTLTCSQNPEDLRVPLQSSFFVSESGQIPAETVPAPQREFRMVIARTAATDASMILISAPAGDREGFIELVSWDSCKQAFNFYRRPRTPDWVWKGDSRSAFEEKSTGKGCFECHVHGAPIMKELRRPWNNWHSQRASIPPEVIPLPEIRNSPLFEQKKGAEDLERLLRQGGWIPRSIVVRVAAAMKNEAVTAAPVLVRPLFDTTTVNLISSTTTSGGSSPTLDLPVDFFFDGNLLGDVLGIDLPSGGSPAVARNLYQAALKKFDFHLADDTFSRAGDTYFAFFVPVRSFADTETIRQLLSQKVVTWHFAASVAMVDFPNPVYSAARSRLLKYVPATAAVQNGSTDLSDRAAAAIVQAASNLPADSPEQRFAAYWKLAPDQLKVQAAKDLQRYFDAVRARLATQAGFDDYVRLAQSRRNRFAESRLNEPELKLLLPRTDKIPKMERRMNADATVSP